MKQSPESMKKQELMNDPQEQRQRLTGSIPSSDKTKDEKGMAQKIHLRNGDCYRYFRTGTCGRSRCIFNHHTQLPEELQDTANMPVCKYFLSGHCKKGSRCDLRHAMNSDGAEPMRPSTSQTVTESRQGIEASGFKRPRSPMNPSVNAQENLQERRQENIKRQRRETQVNLQQQTLMREMPKNHNVEAHNQKNLQEQRQREIERMRLRRLRVAQGLRERTNVTVCKHFLKGYCKKGSECDFPHTMGRDGAEPMPQSTSQRGSGSRQGFEASGFRRPRTPVNHRVNAQVNLQQQRLMREIPENHNVEAHNQGNIEEQRKIEIERKRTEARLKLDQMKPTALFDERSRAREGMEELGFKDAKGI